MLCLATLSLLWVQNQIPDAGRNQIIDAAHLPPIGLHEVKGAYDHPAWVIRGQNQTIDLGGRELKAAHLSGDSQDSYEGIGIFLDKCNNVTLKNARVSGFQCNIVMKGCTNVKVLSGGVSGSRAIRMGSNGKAVDTFLNVRDVAVWKEYGAGIWMSGCKTCSVARCTASGAQNGVVLVDCSGCTLLDNDCSYNSGWGFALWHCNRNTLAWNHADFCNRPWAGGWGGDAAGIVVVNGSEANQFIANSLTHGGDGFFLSDRVNGGFDKSSQTYKIDGNSDLNTVAHNDGSWSSNNAFEGTFSKSNVYYKNLAEDSNYGFWLGFSSQSFLYDNEILRSRSDGVAIGQGQSNTIFRNHIEDTGNVAVHVWSDQGKVEADQPSVDNRIVENRIVRAKFAVSLERSTVPQVLGNTIVEAAVPPEVQLGAPSYAQSTLLANWVYSKEAARIESWMKLKPTNWKFYRDTDGPKGAAAIRIGDYSPVRG